MLSKCAYEGVVPVWDSQTGAQVQHYPLGERGEHVHWSPGGTELLITMHGYFIVLPVWNSTQELIDYVHDCCVIRDQTPKERVQFGLPAKPPE